MKSASAIVAEGRAALTPPPRLKLSEWADAKYYLSAESAAEPGRWTTLPYQREWMDAFTDPRVEQISVIKSARVGYTKVLNAMIGYHVDHDPCAILLVQPTEDDAKGYSKEEIEPMLRDCPVVGEKFVTSAKIVNSMLHKRFRGGLLQLAGARSPGNFRRVSRRVVLGDEVDGYPVSAGKEGDPIALAKRRAEHFWNRKYVWGSTPTIAGASRIEQLFFDGDQRRYYVPCPHCGCMQVLQLKHFTWPSGKPELASYCCIQCGCEIEHAHKRDMVYAGEWCPGPHAQFPDDPPPAPFHGHASFHIWAAYSFSPNATWGHICSEFVAAQKAGPEQLKTFVNTGLGETWKDKGEAPEWRHLYDRREGYAIGACPDGAFFLTAGVDVQKDRLVYEVVAWGRDKRSWSIDAGILPGDTSDLTNGAWPALTALLSRTYPHATGAELHIAMMAIDSGFNTQTVYNWCRTHPINRVIAVKGHESASVLISSPSAVEITVSGQKLKRGYKVWPLGVDLAKSELYGWLRLQLPTPDELAAGAPAVPTGYCSFPQYGEEFFKQLTAEQLVTRKDPSGFPTFRWEMIPGRENHHLDTRVYARAAAALAGLDRFKESDWTALERSLGKAVPIAAPSAAPTGPTPDLPPSSPAPRTAPRPRWIPRQRSGWLKR
jgi:phage terminase large subunit GpA-like protein